LLPDLLASVAVAAELGALLRRAARGPGRAADALPRRPRAADAASEQHARGAAAAAAAGFRARPGAAPGGFGARSGACPGELGSGHHWPRVGFGGLDARSGAAPRPGDAHDTGDAHGGAGFDDHVALPGAEPGDLDARCAAHQPVAATAPK